MEEEKKESPEKKEGEEKAERIETGESKPVVKHVSHQSKDTTKLGDKMKENPWIISTLVLGVVAIIFILSGGIPGSITGGAVGVASQDDVSNTVLQFIESQTGEQAELVDVSLDSGLYTINVMFQGREIPLYVTQDGKNLVQGVTPFETLLAQAPPTDQQQAPPTEVPKSDKPIVELFIMAMCPYGTQAEKGIISAIETLGDKIDFSLRFVSYAMHGKDEIDENTMLYCVQKEEPTKLLDYMKCYLKEQGADKWRACLEEVSIDSSKIDSCIEVADKEFKITELFNDKSSWSGGRYPQYNIDQGLNSQYGVRGSPTLVINGVVSNAGRDSASYLAGICAAFNEAPSQCDQQLSSSSPSPGFGWEGTGAETSASCS